MAFPAFEDRGILRGVVVVVLLARADNLVNRVLRLRESVPEARYEALAIFFR